MLGTQEAFAHPFEAKESSDGFHTVSKWIGLKPHFLTVGRTAQESKSWTRWIFGDMIWISRTADQRSNSWRRCVPVATVLCNENGSLTLHCTLTLTLTNLNQRQLQHFLRTGSRMRSEKYLGLSIAPEAFGIGRETHFAAKATVNSSHMSTVVVSVKIWKYERRRIKHP